MIYFAKEVIGLSFLLDEFRLGLLSNDPEDSVKALGLPNTFNISSSFLIQWIRCIWAIFVLFEIHQIMISFDILQKEVGRLKSMIQISNT